MTENENTSQTPEERGEAIGERLAALQAEESAAAATPEGQKADRKKHVGVIVAVVLFAVLLIGAGIAYAVLAPNANQAAVQGPDPAAQSTADTNAAAEDTNDVDAETAPDFTMTDAEGNTLTLADFRGKPVLLNFWASWCGPCTSEMPVIQEGYERAGDQVQFVIVNMTGMSGETQAAATQFLDEGGYTFPAYFDVDSSAATAFGVMSIPQSYLINADGEIIGSFMGSMSETVMDEGLAMLGVQ